jgi:hypothetical protein
MVGLCGNLAQAATLSLKNLQSSSYIDDYYYQVDFFKLLNNTIKRC